MGDSNPRPLTPEATETKNKPVFTSYFGLPLVQPHRTNNILERPFRDLSRRYRKKSGLNCWQRTIKAMPVDTPLVKNLENEQYLPVLLDGKSSLDERFAEIDANEVRIKVFKLKNESDLVSPKNEKIHQNI